jgi:hypothetical protein
MAKEDRGDQVLPQAVELYRELLAEYAHHVEWMRKSGLSDGEKHDQQLAIGMLAISNYNSAKSVLALFEAGQGEQTLIFVRSQFEQAAKADYFGKHAERARNFLDLEPFERFKLTQGYKIKDSLRDKIVAECKEKVKRHPHLLRHQGKTSKRKVKPDFLAIREALKLPSMEVMLKKLKWDSGLYVTIFLFGSLRVHGSINDLRNYLQRRKDGSVTFAPEQDLRGVPDYLLQSMAYPFGFIGKIAEWFPGAGRESEVLALRERHTSLAKELGLR